MESHDTMLTRLAHTRVRELLIHYRAQRGIVFKHTGALTLVHEWTNPILQMTFVHHTLAKSIYVTPYRSSSPEFADLSLLANVAGTTDRYDQETMP